MEEECESRIQYTVNSINPLNAELNPICHLLASLEAHLILHISRIKVNLAPIELDRCQINYQIFCIGSSRNT